MRSLTCSQRCTTICILHHKFLLPWQKSKIIWDPSDISNYVQQHSFCMKYSREVSRLWRFFGSWNALLMASTKDPAKMLIMNIRKKFHSRTPRGQILRKATQLLTAYELVGIKWEESQGWDLPPNLALVLLSHIAFYERKTDGLLDNKRSICPGIKQAHFRSKMGFMCIPGPSLWV